MLADTSTPPWCRQFGSKADAAVKHILEHREKHPQAKVLVFSEFPKALDLIKVGGGWACQFAGGGQYRPNPPRPRTSSRLAVQAWWGD